MSVTVDKSSKLAKGTVVKDKWTVVRMLGEGGCGVVYEVNYDKGKAALKLEALSARKEDEILKMEVHVLNKLQGKRHACMMLGCGRTDKFNFIAMTLLGQNLADLRRVCPEQRFTTSTAVRMGIQCVNAIKELHSVGYIHRDIKPSNFALGGSEITKRTVFILDFGLARQFETVDKDGKRALREPRTDVAFRGTIRYCSLNVHLRLEQGRHDDLWSLLYMMIELIRGRLPWRNKGKEGSKRDKQIIDDKTLLERCPAEFYPILQHLKALKYQTEPDYRLILNQMKTCLQRHQYKDNDPYDWEEGGRYYQYFLCQDEETISERTDSEVMKRDTDSAPDTIQDTDDIDKMESEGGSIPDSGHEDTRKDLSDMKSTDEKTFM